MLHRLSCGSKPTPGRSVAWAVLQLCTLPHALFRCTYLKAHHPACNAPQLSLVHGQIVSLLTSSALTAMFERNPGYDARRLLGECMHASRLVAASCLHCPLLPHFFK